MRLMLGLLLVATSALADTSVRGRTERVTTLELHPLLGPFRSPEDFFGCKRFDCFETWDATVHSHDAQFVSRDTPKGWFVDGAPIDQFLCGREVEASASGSGRRWSVVQFYGCDVDPPDGTFLDELAGVVVCDVTSAPRCSRFTPLDGWDMHSSDDPDPKKLAPVKWSGSELVIARHHFRLPSAREALDHTE